MKVKTRYKCKIIGSDYSAQEPRMNAHISDAYTDLPNPYYIDPNFITDDFENPITAEGLKQISDMNKKFIEHTIEEKGLKYLKDFLSDENNNPKLCVNKMKQAYMEDKDLYAMIAQSAFNNRYEDNLEFYPEGTELEIDGKKIIAGKKTHKNPDGKDRRSVGKTLNLASSYGMAGATAGARMNKTKEEGEALLDSFFRGFPAVAVAISESKKFLKKYGYVEDFFGRRRHLPEINDPAYEIKRLESDNSVNPFINCNKPRAKSYAEVFWTQIKEFYQALSQQAPSRRRPDWKENGEMPNEIYERLAKVALYPNLWNQPCTTEKAIETMIDRGYDDKKLRKYIKCKNFHQGGLNGNVFIIKESGRYSVAYKELLKDENGKYIILTNLEKLQNDICEYYEVVLPNMQVECKSKNIPPYIPEVQISPNIELPTKPVLFIANTGRKAQAERQCFNARIQGGAATLTKLAMIDIAADQEMKDCKAKLIIPVHDELLVECPAYYADRVFVRLPQLMVGAAKKGGIEIPQKCDPYCVDRWYADEMAALLLDEYTKLIKGDAKKGIAPVSKAEALDTIYKKHEEIPAQSILDVIEGRTPDEVIF